MWPLGRLAQIGVWEGAVNSLQNWDCEYCTELKSKSACNTTPRHEWLEQQVLSGCHSCGASFSVILLAFPIGFQGSQNSCLRGVFLQKQPEVQEHLCFPGRKIFAQLFPLSLLAKTGPQTQGLAAREGTMKPVSGIFHVFMPWGL